MAFVPYSIRGEDGLGDEWAGYEARYKAQFESSAGKPTPSFDLNIEDPMNDQSNSDQPLDYSELVEQEAYLGDVPFESILEGLQEQFADYINLEDKNNYVDIFYDQLHTSYANIKIDDEEDHPNELKEALDKIHQQFIDFITDLFKTRLTISIMDLESEDVDYDDLEFIIRRLYEFFILDARNNFKVAITKDIIGLRINGNIQNDDEYFRAIQEAIDLYYNPLITGITPTDFLRYRGDQEIIELFENNRVVGNFLRKYTPKLYQNEEFQVELVNYITMVQQFGEEIANGGE